jgi:F-type H+-transporting ATPase subunit b
MHVLSGALLDLDGTLFVQLAIFMVAFFVLRSLVFRPIMALFDAREQAIDGERSDARRMEREANEKAARYDDAMRRLRVAAAEERERLRQDGVRLERTILDKVRADTQKEMDTAERNLDAEARAVRREMETTVPALAKDVASRLLGREVQ